MIPDPTKTTEYAPPPEPPKREWTIADDDPDIEDCVMALPTEYPDDTVLAGDGWLRRGDVNTVVGPAGFGKTVAAMMAAIFWALGLMCLGIKPKKPLRIVLFSAEDDRTTLGQIREGALEHAKQITGREVTPADLEKMSGMLLIDFSRKFAGDAFFERRLEPLIKKFKPDLVIVNPLVSYLGGEPVAVCGRWLRENLGPLLQQYNCGALIFAHTPKLNAETRQTLDPTYSAIGGSEMGGVPRGIITMMPTSSEDVCMLVAAKRKTTGWKDAEGNRSDKYLVKRSGNPERPAWIPLPPAEATEFAQAERESKGRQKKVTERDVAEIVRAARDSGHGTMSRQELIKAIRQSHHASGSTAERAIDAALKAKSIKVAKTAPTPRGGQPTVHYGTVA